MATSQCNVRFTPKSGVDFRNARTARSRSLWHDDVADVASLALTGSQRRNRPRRPSRELRDQGCQRCAVGTRKPVSSGCRNWFCRSSFRICHMRPSMTPKASAASKVTRLQTITMISVPLPRGGWPPPCRAKGYQFVVAGGGYALRGRDQLNNSEVAEVAQSALCGLVHQPAA